jgi:type II secretory pathway pseudopilin PulG
MKKMPGVQKKTWTNIGLGVLAFITLIGFLLWNIYLQDQKKRDDLLQQAENISQVIDSNVLQQLTGTPEDQSSPYYQQLKQQLMATRRIYPDVRFMYILSQKEDDSIFFHIDSEPSGSPDESLPGDSFPEPTEKLIESIK